MSGSDRLRGSVEAARRSEPGFGFLGWTGNSNLGDDAIEQVLAQQLAPRRLVPAPMTPAALLRLHRDAPERVAMSHRRLLLGGGTVIGRANWRLHVAMALRACRGGKAVMIGAGVEDPTFRGRHSFSSFGELRHWRHLLSHRFESVTVRGPRSAELCAEIGIEAEVVGDPALLATLSARPDPDGPVVVSLGFGDALRGSDQVAVVTGIGQALLLRPDREVVAVSVNPSDRVWAEDLRVMLGSRVRQVDAFDLAAFDRAIDGAAVIVAERLHAGILGAAAGFAPVMLSYQPKVDDFAASVGLDVHATDELVPGWLAEAMDGAVHRPEVAVRVGLLRARLTQEIDKLRAMVPV